MICIEDFYYKFNSMISNNLFIDDKFTTLKEFIDEMVYFTYNIEDADELREYIDESLTKVYRYDLDNENILTCDEIIAKVRDK